MTSVRVVRCTGDDRLRWGVARDDLQVGLAGLLGGSGLIHLAVTPAHLSEYRPSGLFFAICAVLQLVLAVRCLRSGTRLAVLASSSLSILVAVVWLVSRTFGLPVGPDAGAAEPVGLADIVATTYEVGAVVVGALLWPAMTSSRWRARLSPAMCTIAIVFLWITVGAIYTAH